MLSNENILVEIYDQDYGEDEPMGVAHINVKEISEVNQLQEQWVPLTLPIWGGTNFFKNFHWS